MVVVLLLLALAMVATGGAAVVFGAPIIQVERGWAMVISGTIVASSGLLLLGVALACQRLGRIARETLLLRDRLASSPAPQSPASTAPARPAPPPVPEPPRQPAADLPPLLFPTAQQAPPPVPEPPVRDDSTIVVGQYASGGNNYVMFADGSIQADTQSGRRRFASLDELRAFVADGGERR